MKLLVDIKSNRNLISQRGSSLVQAMILTVILGGLGLLVVQVGQRASQTSKQLNTTQQAKLSRDQVMTILQTDGAWIATSQKYLSTQSPPITIQDCLAVTPPADPNHECATRPSFDRTALPAGQAGSVSNIPAGELKPLRVFTNDAAVNDPADLDTGVFYEPTATSNLKGFKPDGSICNPFGTADCPYRMTYRWGMACDPAQATCKNPIVIYGDLQVAPNVRETGVNEKRFAIREQVVTQKDAQKANCISLGGTFDPTIPISDNNDPNDASGVDAACKCADGGIANVSCRRFSQALNSICSIGQELYYDYGDNTLKCRAFP